MSKWVCDINDTWHAKEAELGSPTGDSDAAEVTAPLGESLVGSASVFKGWSWSVYTVYVVYSVSVCGVHGVHSIYCM